jgi:hypothetical protein
VDTEKLKQAIQETVIVFGIAFAVSFGGFLSGLSKLPNFEEGKAAIVAALVAGAAAVGKGAVWFFTGTKVASRSENESGQTNVLWIVVLVLAAIALLIFIANNVEVK